MCVWGGGGGGETLDTFDGLLLQTIVHNNVVEPIIL